MDAPNHVVSRARGSQEEALARHVFFEGGERSEQLEVFVGDKRDMISSFPRFI